MKMAGLRGKIAAFLVVAALAAGCGDGGAAGDAAGAGAGAANSNLTNKVARIAAASVAAEKNAAENVVVAEKSAAKSAEKSPNLAQTAAKNPAKNKAQTAAPAPKIRAKTSGEMPFKQPVFVEFEPTANGEKIDIRALLANATALATKINAKPANIPARVWASGVSFAPALKAKSRYEMAFDVGGTPVQIAFTTAAARVELSGAEFVSADGAGANFVGTNGAGAAQNGAKISPTNGANSNLAQNPAQFAALEFSLASSFDLDEADVKNGVKITLEGAPLAVAVAEFKRGAWRVQSAPFALSESPQNVRVELLAAPLGMDENGVEFGAGANLTGAAGTGANSNLTGAAGANGAGSANNAATNGANSIFAAPRHFAFVSPALAEVTLQSAAASTTTAGEVILRFSHELDAAQDVRELIAISPALDFTASVIGREVRVRGNFIPTQSYDFAVSAGLRAATTAAATKRSFAARVVFSELDPALAFSSEGIFLPSGAEKKIAFKTRNVERVRVQIHKVYANNLAEYLRHRNFVGAARANSEGTLGYWGDGIEYTGDLVFEREFELAGGAAEGGFGGNFGAGGAANSNLDGAAGAKNGAAGVQNTAKNAANSNLANATASTTQTQPQSKPQPLAPRNEWQQHELSLDSLRDKNGRAVELDGVFVITIGFDERGVQYDFSQMQEWKKRSWLRENGEISKNVIFSNLALTAQAAGGEIFVNVRDFTTLGAVAGAKIAAISAKNQLLAEAVSDQQGDAKFALDYKDVFFITASSGAQTSILKLNAPLSTDGFDVSGVINAGRINAFTYTERGVYRPGDAVHFSAVVRNDAGFVRHPVSLTLRDPRGQNVFENATLMPRGDGVFYHKIALGERAETGAYTAILAVANQKFEHKILVQAIVAERLEIKIDAPKSVKSAANSNLKQAGGGASGSGGGKASASGASGGGGGGASGSGGRGANGGAKTGATDGEKPNLPAATTPRVTQFDLNTSAKYLFGAPAANLRTALEVNFEPQTFTHPRYKDYTFANPTLQNSPARATAQLTLDADGRGVFNVVLPREVLAAKNANYVASANVEVFEAGGRGSKATSRTAVENFDYFVGVKRLENAFINSGETVAFDLLVSALDGELVAGKRLAWRVWQNRRSWWRDYSSYEHFLRSVKRESALELVAAGEAVSANEPVRVEFDSAGRLGDMLFEVSVVGDADENYNNVNQNGANSNLISGADGNSGANSAGAAVANTANSNLPRIAASLQAAGVSAAQHFYLSSWGEPASADIPTALEIRADAASYEVGQRAKIEFASTKGSRAFVTISSAQGVLRRFEVPTSEGKSSFWLDIEQDFAPNVYASVTLLQDYASWRNDRALRLFGVVPLIVNDPRSRLELAITAPEKIAPNGKLEIEVASADGRDFTFTLAVVDEGLLSLTAFKTPDIHGGFFAKAGFGLRTFDTYSQLIARTFGRTNRVLWAGGDGEAAMLLGAARNTALDKTRAKEDEQAGRFESVVLFSEPQKSVNGRARVSFNVPNYMGSLRVMAVAASDEAGAGASAAGANSGTAGANSGAAGASAGAASAGAGGANSNLANSNGANSNLAGAGAAGTAGANSGAAGASFKGAFGSAQKRVIVTAPIVVLQTLPRIVRAGDEFEILVQLFKTQTDGEITTNSTNSADKNAGANGKTPTANGATSADKNGANSNANGATMSDANGLSRGSQGAGLDTQLPATARNDGHLTGANDNNDDADGATTNANGANSADKNAGANGKTPTPTAAHSAANSAIFAANSASKSTDTGDKTPTANGANPATPANIRAQAPAASGVVTLADPSGLLTLTPRSAKFEFGANATTTQLVFRAKAAQKIGTSRVQLALTAGDYAFDSATALQVKAQNTFTYTSQKRVLKAGESATFALPAGTLAGTGEGVLKLSPVPFLELDSRLAWLMDYPYGCLEQTISAALPQLFIDKLSARADHQRATNHVNAAIAKLAEHQTADGGFAYWRGGKNSDTWGSNYAGMFLLAAREAGFYVPDGVYLRWLKYTQNYVKSGLGAAARSKNGDFALNPNALYKATAHYLLALAKEPNITAMNALFERRAELDVAAAWQLVAAYKLAGFDAAARRIAQTLPTDVAAGAVDVGAGDANSNLAGAGAGAASSAGASVAGAGVAGAGVARDFYSTPLRDAAIVAMAYHAVYDEPHEALLARISDELQSTRYLSTQTAGCALLAIATGYELDADGAAVLDASVTSGAKKWDLSGREMVAFRLGNDAGEGAGANSNLASVDGTNSNLASVDGTNSNLTSAGSIDGKNTTNAAGSVKSSSQTNASGANSNLTSAGSTKPSSQVAAATSLTVTTKAQLFASFATSGISLAPVPAHAKNLRITRTFLDENGAVLDVSRLRSGQSFWVKISVKKLLGSRLENVALTQPLPAGWEVKTALLGEAAPAFARDSAHDFKDVRDDKAMWFFALDGREKSFYLHVGAVTPGNFSFAGASAEAMYDENFSAMSASARVEVLR